MDSLFANYASSDDEEADIPKKPTPPIPPPRLFSSLPLPESHHDDDDHQPRKPTKKPPPSFFSSSLPPPKTPSSSSSSLFSSLPPPKPANPPINPPPKRVVKFTPPINPSLLKSHPDDEDEAKQRKPRKDFSSPAPSKFLSSMLPAPKNSLCLAPAPASSRRSVLQADTPVVNPSVESRQEQEAAVDSGGFGPEPDASVYENYGSYDGNWANRSVDAGADGSLQPGFSSGGESSSWDMNHGGVSDYGNYAGNWSDGAMATMAQDIPDMGRIAGKRGRKEMPLEIVEVKQDELMKNRPREDQTKLTGIAFGPSYQPVSSGKGGKPSKLHKRKHQIGSLYFDMKQKEMELAERRSRGTLTKAETQAKYGW